ncbi:MAG: LytTR family DNA-binding domain-containing protein [Pseudomonadota bacterium]
MTFPSTELLDRYRPWQRSVEFGFWIGLYSINAVANSVVQVMNYRRNDIAIDSWQPAVWESSSAIVLLVLVPVVVWFTRKVPPSWNGWRRYLMLHLAGSIVYSLLHVVFMVGLRHLTYAFTDANYDFGHWGRELLYEYLKDVRSYAGVVLTVEGYRFIVRRLQGEARWLDRAENEPEPARPEPPERFLVKMLGREFLVLAAQIEWAQAAGNYVNLQVNRREYPLRSTMKSLLDRLDPNQFQRVHRSYIVNLDQVAEIEPLETGDARVTMKSGTQLPCSRRYRGALIPD